MKKRRIVIVTFLAAAVILLGVGFAALSDSLSVSGSAKVEDSAANEVFDNKVYFASAAANDSGNTASVGSDNDTATFTVSNLKGKDNTATFTFVVKNESDVNATIENFDFTSSNSAYFEITDDITANTALNAGASVTVTVTVKLLKTPTETVSGTFTAAINVTSVSAD